jgi:hypothetical protein
MLLRLRSSMNEFGVGRGNRFHSFEFQARKPPAKSMNYSKKSKAQGLAR